MTHMVTIYIEKEEKYILKMRNEDGEVQPSKGSSGQEEVKSHEEVRSKLTRDVAIVASMDIVRNKR